MATCCVRLAVQSVGWIHQSTPPLIRPWVTVFATKFENLGRQSPLRFSLLTVAGLLALMFAFFIPSFQSNDDPQLMMIAAGKGACQLPDEHLVFTNVVIGHVLKSLYSAFPSIPWYGGYLYFAQYLGQVAILYCTIAPGYTRLRLGLYLAFFAIEEVFLFNNLQFTMTAALVGQGGAFVCLLALRRMARDPGCRVRVLQGSGIALLVLASLIRLECFYLTSIVALPAAICLIGWSPRRGILLSTAWTAGICLAMVLGLAAYNEARYAHDPQWRGFFDYNQVRIKFNDYEWISYTPRTAHLFEQVEWSKNDHKMILNWFYDDPVLYSKANLQHLLDSYPWRDQRLTAAYWQSWMRTMWYDKSVWSIGLVLPLFFVCSASTRQDLLAFLASAAAALTLLGCLAVFSKVPPSRVYFPALMFPLALLLVMARDEVAMPRRRRPGLALRCLVSPTTWRRPAMRLLFRPARVDALLILALVALTYSIKPQYRRSHKVQAARHELLEYVESLKPRGDQLYVVWAPGFPYEVISPFDSLESFSNLNQLVLGWPQQTPFFESMKQKFGVDSVPSALYERPDVFLLGLPDFHSLYRNFVREHFGINVRFVTSHTNEHVNYVVGRFEPEAGSQIAGAPPNAFEAAAMIIVEEPEPSVRDSRVQREPKAAGNR